MTIHTTDVQQIAMHHPMIVIVEGDKAYIWDLTTLTETSPADAADFAAHLTAGLPFRVEATDEDPAFVAYSLAHRDAPLNMTSRRDMDIAYTAFRAVYDLPDMQAEQALAAMVDSPVCDLRMVHWLSAFVETYLGLEG